MLYTIVQDANHYRSFIWDDAQITRLVGDADMELRIDMWNSPKSFKGLFKEALNVSFTPLSKNAESLAIPDISVAQGRLFLNPKAYRLLEPIIREDGEFLPLKYEHGEAYLFNPLRVAEKAGALNQQLSTKNEWGDLENLSFHEDKVKDWSLFRCEYDVYMSLNCREDIKQVIETNELNGVFFTENLGTIYSNQFDE
ncbi:hypothetical protein NBRC116591_30550 [Sessilibacter corallicola]|uniref:Uncharacterized protein n=2 Tax=Sessilibacter corallicola TaxID=2904075 RepID=A0ABQ0AC75_9GAMM